MSTTFLRKLAPQGRGGAGRVAAGRRVARLGHARTRSDSAARTRLLCARPAAHARRVGIIALIELFMR